MFKGITRLDDPFQKAINYQKTSLTQEIKWCKLQQGMRPYLKRICIK